METAELVNQLGFPHRATAAYRALFGMGFAVAPAAREGLRHANADVRYHCLRLLDHFLVPEVLSDLIGTLRDPIRVFAYRRCTHWLATAARRRPAARMKQRCFPRHCGYCMRMAIIMCVPWPLKGSASTYARTHSLSEH
jgi:hypothetical protein